MADATHEEVVKAVRAKILESSSVTDLIGSRVLLGSAGESPSLPYVVFDIEDSDIPRSHSGQSGFEIFEFAVEVFGESTIQAIRIRDAITAAIKDFSGTVNGTFIQLIRYEGQSTFKNEKRRIFGALMDLTVYV